jgi:hypothetical protein
MTLIFALPAGIYKRLVKQAAGKSGPSGKKGRMSG